MNKVTGERIKKLRESRGMSKQKLADELNMKSYTSVTGWEKGDNLPRGLEMIKLAKLFNVSTDYLYGLSDKERWED